MKYSIFTLLLACMLVLGGSPVSASQQLYENSLQNADHPVIWRNETGLESERQIFAAAFQEGYDSIWSDYAHRKCAVRDFNGDGRMEMIVKAWQDQNVLFIGYSYDDNTKEVRRIDCNGSNFEDFYYSEEYNSIVMYYHTAGHSTYAFYRLNDGNMEKKFMVSEHSLEGDTWYTYAEGEGEGVRIETSAEGKLPEDIWLDYVHSLEKIDFYTADVFDDYQRMMELDDAAQDNAEEELWRTAAAENWYPGAEETEPPEDMLAANYADGEPASLLETYAVAEDVIPYIVAWLSNTSYWLIPDEAGFTTCTLSYLDDEIFWNYMCSYAILNVQRTGVYNSDGTVTYSAADLIRIAFAACPSYDGALPEIPGELYVIENGDNTFSFHLATPEEYQCRLRCFSVDMEGRIRADYDYEGIDGNAVLHVRMSPTEHISALEGAEGRYRITELTFTPTGRETVSWENQTGTLASDDYILPQSRERYLSYEDVAGLTLQQINYAKNEIYARAGRKFNSQELQDYFGSKAWYTGSYEPAEFDQELGLHLNEYEIANGEFLNQIEHELSPEGYQLY